MDNPGIIPQARVHDLFEFVDVLPSLAQLLDRPLPVPYLEQRRRHLFSGRDRGGDGVAFAEWRAWTDRELARLARRNPSYDFTGLARNLVCARSTRFKLLAGSDGSRMLYDLQRDPNETTDVAAAHPGEAARLTTALEVAQREWATWEGEPPPEYSPEDRREIERRLAELGYI